MKFSETNISQKYDIDVIYILMGYHILCDENEQYHMFVIKIITFYFSEPPPPWITISDIWTKKMENFVFCKC